jgi:hypothetical protein
MQRVTIAFLMHAGSKHRRRKVRPHATPVIV